MSITLTNIANKLKRRGVKLIGIRSDMVTVLCVCGKVQKGDLNRVLLSRRCVFCNCGRSEALTRKIYEGITQKEFVNCRPSWLNGLELDGYNEELQMAFEYNGIQHYKYMPGFFHKKGIKTFNDQLRRDKLKEKICSDRGIQLHVIPYVFNYTNETKLREFIQTKISGK